ncbi:MAG TPA: protease HtpX [Cellvibrionaceae bacterium]|nr:protease HtpX [Cellvibrionaceae bacterium]HMW46698.1 protease HtpX [Cellvibrionaceae bacterium]HMW70189.1 protease HtpX [Cellvibrionaceae bacterium]HNG59599.1 protease HtpX [Cellvibrionaceae bacterium]
MMRIVLFLLTNLAVMLVAGITLNLLGVSHFVERQGMNFTSLLIYCAVFGFTGSFISLFLSKSMAKMSTGTQIITTPQDADEAWLVQTVQELADKAGIAMPEVGIFPSQDANAFATGWNRNAALVAVSAGLLQRFSRDEVRAVMAHEIGHVANGDMVTLTLIQGVVNTFVMFFARIVGYAVDSVLRRGNQSSYSVGFGYYIGSMVAEVVFGIVASMIVAWFSRLREFRADQAGAQFASKHGMISALQRLQFESQQHTDSMPAALSAFAISSGIKGKFFALLATHPPLEVRIQALSQMPV